MQAFGFVFGCRLVGLPPLPHIHSHIRLAPSWLSGAADFVSTVFVTSGQDINPIASVPRVEPEKSLGNTAAAGGGEAGRTWEELLRRHRFRLPVRVLAPVLAPARAHIRGRGGGELRGVAGEGGPG